MIKWLSRILLLQLSLIGLACWSEDYSSWQKFSKGKLILETTSVAPGHRAQMGLLIDLAPGWHVYWSNPGDTGEPISVKIESDPILEIGTGELPYPKRLEVAGITSFAHENQLLIPIQFFVPKHLSSGSQIEISAKADWLICQKVCIPAGGDILKLVIPVTDLEMVKPGSDAKIFTKFQSYIPTIATEEVIFTQSGDKVKLKFPKWTTQYEFIDFFPYRKKGVKNSAPIMTNSEPLELELVENPKRVSAEDEVKNIGWGVLLMRTPDTNHINAWSFGSSGWSVVYGLSEKPQTSVIWILLSAFLGGLILNAMPCVFPILSMKLLSLVKIAKSSPREVLKQNLAYTAGVLVSFLLIGILLLLLRQSGQLVGWGFQLQSPVFVASLVWLFTLLNLQLLGFLELDFLDLNIGGRLTRLHGVAGSFFTGVLAVVVASPCTAPFMGVALGFALVAPWFILLLIFGFLGLGLASPYLMLSIFPPIVKVLPRPGPWMKRFKEIMALPLVLTALWLLWLIGQLAGVATVSVVLAGVIVLVFCVWLSRWQKLLSWVMASLFLIMSVGWIYQQKAPEVSAQTQSGPWINFRPEIWKEYPNQIVYIDVTADWCLTCKVNERLVLDSPEILEMFKKNNVVLVKADWTQRNPDITKLLSQFSRAGVPFNVLFSPRFPQGKILPEVLTKSEVKQAIEDSLM